VRPALVFRLAVIGAAAAFIATYPLYRSNVETLKFTQVGYYLIAIMGLNILSGYSGQITLGHGAFMGVGAYTTAILVTKTSVTDVATIPIAAAVAGIVGFAFGFPALRLHGVYLALATFGAAVAFIQLVQSTHYAGFTGGATGLFYGLPKNPYYLTWSIAAGAYVVAWLLLRSKLGRAFTAVRDSPCPRASTWRSRRRSHSGSPRPTPASPARCWRCASARSIRSAFRSRSRSCS
jgi:branched-chain amino acid transport system permease protein